MFLKIFLLGVWDGSVPCVQALVEGQTCLELEWQVIVAAHCRTWHPLKATNCELLSCLSRPLYNLKFLVFGLLFKASVLCPSLA